VRFIEEKQWKNCHPTGAYIGNCNWISHAATVYKKLMGKELPKYYLSRINSGFISDRAMDELVKWFNRNDAVIEVVNNE